MKNTIIYINDKEAQVTKAFEKQARIFGTPEYELWKSYRKDFPDAKMVTKTIKKNSSKRTYKNLTYANMERFLMQQSESAGLLKEFTVQKEIASIQQNPYRAVLAWFLKTFPDYDDYKTFFAGQDIEDGNSSTESASANAATVKSETQAA